MISTPFCLRFYRNLPTELLKTELLEEKHPNEIKPTENETATDRNDDANDKTNKTALLKECGPSYNKLGYPVYEGDDEKKKLYETALLIKPSHYVFPPYKIICFTDNIILSYFSEFVYRFAEKLYFRANCQIINSNFAKPALEEVFPLDESRLITREELDRVS